MDRASIEAPTRQLAGQGRNGVDPAGRCRRRCRVRCHARQL